MRWEHVIRGVIVALLAVGVSACAMNDVPGGSSTDAGPLLSSLQATVTDDAVLFTFQLTNTSPEAVVLEFNTGQEYDFSVMDGTREVWRWSADRYFTQALRSETLAAGETRVYEATWNPPAEASGTREVVARLTSRSHPVEQRAEFEM